jgi:hypothetical protein
LHSPPGPAVGAGETHTPWLSLQVMPVPLGDQRGWLVSSPIAAWQTSDAAAGGGPEPWKTWSTPCWC